MFVVPLRPIDAAALADLGKVVTPPLASREADVTEVTDVTVKGAHRTWRGRLKGAVTQLVAW